MSENDVRARRRELAAEIGIEGLEDLEPPCDWEGHDAGENGCEAGAPAEYVVRIRAHCDLGGHIRPVVLLVCQAQQIRLRGRGGETLDCNVCGQPAAWSDLVDYLGTIWEYRAHER